jgi:predicted dehydrogenase
MDRYEFFDPRRLGGRMPVAAGAYARRIQELNDPRVCIVGAGNLSTRRIYPYIGAAGGEIIAVCDLDGEKATRNARRFGGVPYDNVELMLADHRPDGVIVCVGPEQHAELATMLLRRGIPVYTEKPPALNADDTLAVARVARETGVLCTTAFKKRYTTAASRARAWLNQFDESDYYSLSIDYASAQYPNENARSSFLLHFGIHAIDLVQYFFGNVSEVFAFARGRDAYAISLRFANGAVGSLNLNDGRSFQIPTEEVELTVRGGNFMSIHNSSIWKITQQGVPHEWREPATFVSAGDSGHDTGHMAEIEDFFAAIREGRSTRSDIFESYRTMVLYEAICRSVDTAQPVHVTFEPV